MGIKQGLNAFKMTKNIIRLVKAQRTCYRKTHPDNVPELYFTGCYSDLKNIVPHLPENTGSILDIGCGMAGVDILLHRHFGGKIDIHLFDLERVDADIAYGFSETPSVYNQFKHVRNFFDINGIDRNRYTTSSVFPKDRHFDATISLISMGFHYPVDEYLPLINSDVLILDVRKTAAEQKQMLSGKFATLKVIKDAEKYERVLCTNRRSVE